MAANLSHEVRLPPGGVRVRVFVRCRDQVRLVLLFGTLMGGRRREGEGWRTAAAWPSLLWVFWRWRLMRCDFESPTL